MQPSPKYRKGHLTAIHVSQSMQLTTSDILRSCNNVLFHSYLAKSTLRFICDGTAFNIMICKFPSTLRFIRGGTTLAFVICPALPSNVFVVPYLNVVHTSCCPAAFVRSIIAMSCHSSVMPIKLFVMIGAWLPTWLVFWFEAFVLTCSSWSLYQLWFVDFCGKA